MPISNFNFRNPTRILFGKGSISQLNDYLPRDKHFIMTYGGGSIKKNGVYDQVVKALDGREFEEFGGIEANPDYDTLIKCINRIKEIGPDKCYLLAVGGGSIIDGTKFIACASYCETDPWVTLVLNQTPFTKAVPIASVLTLPATGSESNSGCVVSRRKLHV